MIVYPIFKRITIAKGEVMDDQIALVRKKFINYELQYYHILSLVTKIIFFNYELQ